MYSVVCKFNDSVAFSISKVACKYIIFSLCASYDTLWEASLSIYPLNVSIITMRKQNIRVRLLIFKENKVLLMHDSSLGFYFYPGGHIEFGETIKRAAEREAFEECNDQFIFEKILYIRDYFDNKKDEHALEFYILGRLKNNRSDNSKDPSGRKTQTLEWFDINNLPENLFPKTLSKKLKEDFEAGFPDQGEYLGIID